MSNHPSRTQVSMKSDLKSNVEQIQYDECMKKDEKNKTLLKKIETIHQFVRIPDFPG